jgi:hypothetical protein
MVTGAGPGPSSSAAGRAAPPRNRAISSSGRWVADSAMRCGGAGRRRWSWVTVGPVVLEPAAVADLVLEPLEGEREVAAALGRGHRVDLVDDDGLDVRSVSRACEVSIR